MRELKEDGRVAENKEILSLQEDRTVLSAAEHDFHSVRQRSAVSHFQGYLPEGAGGLFSGKSVAAGFIGGKDL